MNRRHLCDGDVGGGSSDGGGGGTDGGWFFDFYFISLFSVVCFVWKDNNEKYQRIFIEAHTVFHGFELFCS